MLLAAVAEGPSPNSCAFNVWVATGPSPLPPPPRHALLLGWFRMGTTLTPAPNAPPAPPAPLSPHPWPEAEVLPAPARMRLRLRLRVPALGPVRGRQEQPGLGADAPPLGLPGS